MTCPYSAALSFAPSPLSRDASVPQYQSTNWITPLSWAVTCWSFDAARKLVELGDEPDLFCASGMGMLENVRAFWDGRGELRANPSRTGSTRYSDSGEPLPCPPRDDSRPRVRCAQLGVARWLLDHRADPNWRGYFNRECFR